MCVRACMRARACVRASGPAWPRSTFASVVSPLALHQHFPRSALFLSFFALSILLSPLSLSPVTVAPALYSSPLLGCTVHASRRCASPRLEISPGRTDSVCFRCRSNVTTRDKEEEKDDRVEDALPTGQACPAVRRRVSCVLSAANKVIIIVAGKAPGGKRATSSSSVCTRFPVCPSVRARVCWLCAFNACIHARPCTCTHYVLHAALARLLATIRARLPRAVWEFLSR